MTAKTDSGPQSFLRNGWGRLVRLVDRRYLELSSWPALAVMIGITAFPFVVTLLLAFTNFDLIRNDDWRFIGLENFAIIGRARQTLTIIFNSLYLVIVGTFLEALFGFVLAMLMRSRIRGIGFIRSLYLLPIMTSPIVVALTWRAMFNNDAGWINYFLSLLHLPEPLWLGNPLLAMPAVIISDMWTGVPFMAVLLLAGLLNVPRELEEAAAVDGAGFLQILRHVTLPWIKPVLFLAMLLKGLELFRKFEGIQVLTSGGPGFASTTLNLHVYNTGLAYHQLGLAAAWALLMSVIIALCAGLFYLLMGRSNIG